MINIRSADNILINTDKIQYSKLFTDFFGKDGELVVHFDSSLILNFINEKFTFEGFRCNIVYDFLNFIKADHKIIIEYIEKNIQKLKYVDDIFLKEISTRHSDILKCVRNNDIACMIAHMKLNNDKKLADALTYACSYNKKVVKILVDYGVNIDIQDDFNFSVLYKAVYERDIEMVKMILGYGADVELLNDTDNMTALHCAVIVNDFRIAELLLKYGADVNVKDVKGKDALYWAFNRKNTEMQLLLKKYGAYEDNCKKINAKACSEFIAWGFMKTDYYNEFS